ncbi:MAG: ABC transporter ATP-binding protein, partial [Corynebacterium casei]|nr:ABC transporter ATP-binding protein [Corynebacterium casei]
GRLVMDLFHELHEQGRTIVFITHNPELAEETSRIVTMVDGNIA